MNTWCGLYKRDFIIKNNIRYNTTPGASFQDNGFYFLTQTFAKRAMLVNKAFYWNRRDNPNSSVKNTEKVYAMSTEYDYIRKCLENRPDLWNQVKGWYWLRKFFNYNLTLHRIDNKYILHFAKLFKKEFLKAEEEKELDLSIFSKHETHVYIILKINIYLYTFLLRKRGKKCL